MHTTLLRASWMWVRVSPTIRPVPSLDTYTPSLVNRQTPAKTSLSRGARYKYMLITTIDNRWCFLIFLLDTCPFVRLLIPLFWNSRDVSSGFKSQSRQPYSNFAEVYIIGATPLPVYNASRAASCFPHMRVSLEVG